MSTLRIAGAVLCGGRSTRMGRDKATLPVDGLAMAVRVTAALRDAGCEPLVAVGGDAGSLGAIGLTVVPDETAGGGAPQAVLTALRWAPGDAVFVAACDLPWLASETVAKVWAALDEHDVAVAVTDRLEPLCAVWRVRVAPTVEGLIANGTRAVHALIEHLDAIAVHVGVGAVRNANTPSDLHDSGSVPRMAIAEIDVAGLEQQLAAGARLVDVREPDEYEDAHVPGASLIPLGTVVDNVDAFRGDGPTYVICKSGGRSMRACELLADQGIDVVNVAGGTMGWIISGRPTAAGDAPA